ncbi:MAG TPA: protein-L-isoaspartate(D-aspartate) O-methyltransferase [Nitrococcus sp.]|nr:protein-L-isoaspartate(D-aspartate) O-methyltransferase [Nitrococcus sp.]
MDARRVTGIGMTSPRTRERMVARLNEAGITDLRVLNAMRQVPRHLFVEEALASRAYDDTALPIGYGQTISQPFVVARMTQVLLEGRELHKVLEVGTGSGYQAAVLASLVPQVFSIERLRVLHNRAQRLMRELRLGNVRLYFGDGYKGWPAEAPFEGIILTAAPATVPKGLAEQLALGGRLVAPIGAGRNQSLVVCERTDQGLVRRDVSRVSFVPMKHGLG